MPRGGLLTLDLRTDTGGAPVARLTVDAGTGRVRADYSISPLQPLGRPAVFEGHIPSATWIEIDLLFDGALVYGTVNGRPIGLLAFAGQSKQDGLVLRLFGEGTRFVSYSVTERS